MKNGSFVQMQITTNGVNSIYKLLLNLNVKRYHSDLESDTVLF